MACDLSESEQEKVITFIERLDELHIPIDPNNSPIPWNLAVKFLMARKFDVRRALDLFISHGTMRMKEDLRFIDPQDASVKRELASEKLTILEGRDSSGAAIALFTARLHFPTETSNKAVLKALMLQLDAATESTETQRNGLVFIYDMTHSRYHNFDYDLSSKILTILKGCYPARLKKVLIVTAPLWFKAPFKILRLFVREKLQERVHTVNIMQLANHIPLNSLPKRFGGTLDINHRDWIGRCLHCVWRKSPDAENEIADYLENLINQNTSDLMRLSVTSMSTGTSFDESDSEADNALDRYCHNKTLDAHLSPTSPFSSGVVMPFMRKRSADGSPTEASNDDNGGPVLPSKKRLNTDGKSMTCSQLSIHMPEPGGFTAKELVQYCKIKGKKGLEREYLEIRSEPPQGTFEVSKARSNFGKNRYTDVLCYDHSRVCLSIADEDQSSHYINANFVDGYKQKNAYISTQGPLPKTCGDFWRMIWEQHALVIVMTTKTVERNRVKCDQYWPLEEQSIDQHDKFALINNSVTTTEHYTITSLLLQNLETLESRTVTHFQFTSWPDYGVPHSAEAFLSFMKCVRETQAERTKELGTDWTGDPLGPPMILHCSAGIGRTGTFITMDINSLRLQDIGTVDIQKSVQRIRSQRAFSIQMPDQYVFCYLALIEHAQREGYMDEVDLEGFHDNSTSDSE